MVDDSDGVSGDGDGSDDPSCLSPIVPAPGAHTDLLLFLPYLPPAPLAPILAENALFSLPRCAFLPARITVDHADERSSPYARIRGYGGRAILGYLPLSNTHTHSLYPSFQANLARAKSCRRPPRKSRSRHSPTLSIDSPAHDFRFRVYVCKPTCTLVVDSSSSDFLLSFLSLPPSVYVLFLSFPQARAGRCASTAQEIPAGRSRIPRSLLADHAKINKMAASAAAAHS